MQTVCGESRFSYWTSPRLVGIDNANELIDSYTSQEGEHHYFDDDTMEFFGTENFHMVAPGISLEFQSNAPEGVGKWTVVAWVYSDDNSNNFTPYTLCRHDERASAYDCGLCSFEEVDSI
jgi:hypothetical protein